MSCRRRNKKKRVFFVLKKNFSGFRNLIIMRRLRRFRYFKSWISLKRKKMNSMLSLSWKKRGWRSKRRSRLCLWFIWRSSCERSKR